LLTSLLERLGYRMERLDMYKYRCIPLPDRTLGFVYFSHFSIYVLYLNTPKTAYGKGNLNLNLSLITHFYLQLQYQPVCTAITWLIVKQIYFIDSLEQAFYSQWHIFWLINIRRTNNKIHKIRTSSWCVRSNFIFTYICLIY
jgi:hypothetical protein